MAGPRIALAPDGVRPWIADAIRAGGAELVDPGDATGLVWADSARAGELNHLLQAHPEITWVQLPWAGVENFAGVIDDQHRWTSGKGVYAEPVAEHVVTLLLAGLRGLGIYARAHEWGSPLGTNLIGAKVAILGGGGITECLLPLLGPFEADITVVRRRPDPMEGAHRVVGPDELEGALDGAVGVVLALALTPETTGIIGRKQLELMDDRGWLVNVARGGHVVTGELVGALQDGVIGGAGLDVTDPEPLPAGHPLWSLPNCIITPHVGNTPEMALPLLSRRIAENVRRFGAGEPLIGEVDPDLGY
jgi:phosphoglycerate dehydrogenase-like enzyme